MTGDFVDLPRSKRKRGRALHTIHNCFLRRLILNHPMILPDAKIAHFRVNKYWKDRSNAVGWSGHCLLFRTFYIRIPACGADNLAKASRNFLQSSRTNSGILTGCYRTLSCPFTTTFSHYSVV